MLVKADAKAGFTIYNLPKQACAIMGRQRVGQGPSQGLADQSRHKNALSCRLGAMYDSTLGPTSYHPEKAA